MNNYQPSHIDKELAEGLIERIENKTAGVWVVTFGYMSLPLVVDKAVAGYQVRGYDVQKKKIDMVNSGKNYVGDVVYAELHDMVSAGRQKATINYDEIKRLDVVTIYVPTPLEKSKQSVLTVVRISAQEAVKF